MLIKIVIDLEDWKVLFSCFSLSIMCVLSKEDVCTCATHWFVLSGLLYFTTTKIVTYVKEMVRFTSFWYFLCFQCFHARIYPYVMYSLPDSIDDTFFCPDIMFFHTVTHAWRRYYYILQTQSYLSTHLLEVRRMIWKCKELYDPWGYSGASKGSNGGYNATKWIN